MAKHKTVTLKPTTIGVRGGWVEIMDIHGETLSGFDFPKTWRGNGFVNRVVRTMARQGYHVRTQPQNDDPSLLAFVLG